MAAGQGFKTFTTGEVLTAADVNGYLMQGVGVFTDAANRDAEITSPQEGQFAYLKDTNVTTYYTGSAWANLDTTGMTNPMTTTGDTIYSSSGSTPARLGIGTTGQVLTVAGGVPTWAAAGGAGANWTAVNAGGTSLTGGVSTVTVSGITAADKLMIHFVNVTSASASSTFRIRFNADSGGNYYFYGQNLYTNASYTTAYQLETNSNNTGVVIGAMGNTHFSLISGYLLLSGGNAAGDKMYNASSGLTVDNGTGGWGTNLGGRWNNSATISSVSIVSNTGNFDNGEIFVWKSA
jgi:hypothetical protein